MATKKSAAKKAPKKVAKKRVKQRANEAAPAPEVTLDSLAARRRHFVVEYLANGFNATAAARSAGYSAKTAESQASRLLAREDVAAVLASRTKDLLEKSEITAKRVIDELAALAFSPRLTIDDKNKIKALELLGRYFKLFVDRVEHKADKEFVLTVRSILGGGTK